MASVRELYANNGVIDFICASNGSLEIHPSNTCSKFINQFHTPIDLPSQEKYTIGVTKFSLPKFQAKLYEKDFKESQISYNISLFKYDKERSIYLPDENSTVELFTLAPNVDIYGLWPPGGENINQNNFFSKIDHGEKLKGPFHHPATPTFNGSHILKKDFLEGYGHSLVLDINLPAVEFERQELLLKLFKKYIKKYALFDASITDENLRSPEDSNNVNTDIEDPVADDDLDSENLGGNFENPHISKGVDIFSPQWILPRALNLNTTTTTDIFSVYQDPNNLLGSFNPYSDIFEFHNFNKFPQFALNELFQEFMFESGFINNNNQFKKLVQDIYHIPQVNSGFEDIISDTNTDFIQMFPQYDSETGKLSTPDNFINDWGSIFSWKFQSFLRENNIYPNFVGIYATFGQKTAKLFNIDLSQRIILGILGAPRLNLNNHFFRLKLDFSKSIVNHVNVFSDLVDHSTRYGSQMTNLLDMLMNNESDEIFTNPRIESSFRPLKNNTIHEASFILTDSSGKDIHFENTVNTIDGNLKSGHNSVLHMRIKSV